MSLKLSKIFEKENKLTEEIGDFDKALGKVLFLHAEPVMVFEDGEPNEETGEIKRYPTDKVDYYEVNVYSDAQDKQIVVKMPAEADLSGLEYEDEIKLTNRSINFWYLLETDSSEPITFQVKNGMLKGLKKWVNLIQNLNNLQSLKLKTMNRRNDKWQNVQ